MLEFRYNNNRFILPEKASSKWSHYSTDNIKSDHIKLNLFPIFSVCTFRDVWDKSPANFKGDHDDAVVGQVEGDLLQDERIHFDDFF